MKGAEKSLVQKQKGRYKFHGDQLEQVNPKRDPERDLEREVTGKDSQLPPPPPPWLFLLPLLVFWSPQ